MTMAVINVTTLQVKPGHLDHLFEELRRTQGTLEAHGAKNFRVLGALVAGETSGTVAVTWEADDMAALGAVWQEFLTDPHGRAAVVGTLAENTDILSWHDAIFIDVDYS